MALRCRLLRFGGDDCDKGLSVDVCFTEGSDFVPFQRVLSAVRLADREFFGCECQRFAVACQPSEDEQSGSETTSEKEYAGIAYDPYGQVAGMQADEQQAGRSECRGAYKYQGRRPEHFEVIDFSHAAKI